MIRPPRPFLPANRQGIAVDALSILLNLFLFPIFSGRIEKVFQESFGNNQAASETLGGLMLFILVCRLFGLYLKRFSLQRRLENAEKTSFPLYFWVLNVPVFILTAAIVSVLMMHLFGKAGFVETNYAGTPKESETLSLAIVFGILFLIALEAFFLYRLSKPLSRKEKRMMEKGNWKFGLRAELLADFGLFAYMIIWQAFYNHIAKIFLDPPAKVKITIEFEIVSLVFLTFAFLMFYLAPRSVFLIEDRKYLGTWLFILLVFLSSVMPFFLI